MPMMPVTIIIFLTSHCADTLFGKYQQRHHNKYSISPTVTSISRKPISLYISQNRMITKMPIGISGFHRLFRICRYSSCQSVCIGGGFSPSAEAKTTCPGRGESACQPPSAAYSIYACLSALSPFKLSIQYLIFFGAVFSKVAQRRYGCAIFFRIYPFAACFSRYGLLYPFPLLQYDFAIFSEKYSKIQQNARSAGNIADSAISSAAQAFSF